MKISAKNLLVLIFLITGFLGLTACQKSGTDSASDTPNSSIVDKNKSENLEVSAETMQSVLTAPDGSNFSLQDYKGKVVLVNFWATWCPPCREEMPGLVKIQNEFKDRDFVVIGVDADDEELDLIKNFGAKMNLNYKLAKADNDFIGSFVNISKAGAIPQSYLINRDGKVTAGWVGGGAKTVAEIRDSVSKLVGN